MQRRRAFLPALCFAALAASAGSAFAALGIDDQSGLNARGLVDLDGLVGPQPRLSLQDETEAVVPFTRSVVTVGDAQAGLFDYSGFADIGTLELGVSGALTNSTANAFFGQGTPLLQVVTEVRDVLTLASTLAGSFDVTMQLNVTGDITANNAQASANSLLAFGPDPGLNTTDSARYTGGPIADLLSVTRTFSGALVEMDFEALLSFTVDRVDAGGSVTGRLDNTAALTLILPAGVTLQDSASGTFGQVIPEPGTYAFLLAGLALAGALARRRTRHATSTSPASIS